MWFIFFIIKSGLLVSKEPEWFGVYSTEKISFILCSSILCILLYKLIKYITLPENLLFFWDTITSRNRIVYLLISIVSLISFIGEGIHVGEDIGGQVKSSLQWINGKVSTPNIILEPQREDLAIDEANWSLRPPGAAILPAIGMLFGLSLGQSIKIGLFLCSITGGMGWLLLFERFNISKNVILILAILLGLMCGASVDHYATANIILFAVTSWFIILSLIISDRFGNSKLSLKGYLGIALFLFALGSFAWVKLSGLIVAGTIGASIFFMFLKNQDSSKRNKFILLFTLCGLFFWIPFFLLENINYTQTGITADQLYSSNDSDIQAPLFGKFWGESTKKTWLVWSLLASPGYSLPVKEISHGIRDFGIQFDEFIYWIERQRINEHVLLCGLLSLLFSILLVVDLRNSWIKLTLDHRILLCCFYSLPFLGLAILAFKYEWNYLLYHAHTFEFWLMICVPTFVTFSSVNSLKLPTVTLLGVIIAIPMFNSMEKLATCIVKETNDFISTTECERGLSSSRFSEAIEYIENDSINDLDIIYFLPAGDMGDLVLRSKMRTLATHFAGGNFPKASPFKTSKELNVYLAYDKKLSRIPEFLKATREKFPNSILEHTISKGSIIIKKFRLYPTLSVS